TGFYRIAEGANVPIYLGFFDYKHKRLGIGQRFDLTGDQDADLRFFQDYYAQFEGRWPEKTTPVEFVDRS
ncbi:MAG: acyltransferase, partial [Woeseiaceae bacterium]|nr:acyltransferase [Woeseiaceae bacterium]